jgi:cobalamin biosynthesis Mg chelatase CobN
MLRRIWLGFAALMMFGCLVLGFASHARADSSVDQYLEQVPNGDGSKANGGGTGGGKGGPSKSPGGSSSGSSGSGKPGGGSGHSNKKKKKKKKKTAQTPNGGSTSSAPALPKETAQRSGQPLGQAGNSSGGLSVGALLVLFAAIATLVAVFVFVRRNRLRSDSDNDGA